VLNFLVFVIPIPNWTRMSPSVSEAFCVQLQWDHNVCAHVSKHVNVQNEHDEVFEPISGEPVNVLGLR
jgi:hypothetical protein